MKIALVVRGGVDRGGTEQVVPCLLALIERLVRQGHEVHVFAACQEPRPGRWPLLGATVHNAGRRPHSLWLLRDILSEHRRGRFDAIHAFSGGMGIAGTLASRITGAPLVLTLIGGEVVRLPSIGHGMLLSPRGRWTLRIAAARAHTVTAESGPMRALAAGFGIDARILPLGVDLETWPPIPMRRRVAGAPIRLLHVASLNRVKDQSTLLRAMAILRERGVPFELDVVGFDTLEGEIQRMAARFGFGREVAFHGYHPHFGARLYFERADLLVMSSMHEGGPVVVLEAALAGVPTVGTEVGHILDLAPGAATAVRVGDAPGLASAVEELSCDEPRRMRMAAAAQAFAVRHDADYTASAMADIYGTAGSGRTTISSRSSGER